MLCPSHKFKLAIGDAFQPSALNTETEKCYNDVYYLFKKAPLRWRLLKRQALFLGMKQKRYKRLYGTRWVEHRVASLDSHLVNLPILLGFCDHQIVHPHNSTIKKIVPTLAGIRKEVAKTDAVLFTAVELDILALLRPMSKILQDDDLLRPVFITTWSMTITKIGRMCTILDDEGRDAFDDAELFPRTSKLLNELTNEEGETPFRQSRSDSRANPKNLHSVYHGYLLTGTVEVVINKVVDEF